MARTVKAHIWHPFDGDPWYATLVIERADVYLEKATESLAGAESAFINGRYNNCANRCYYAAFQAAIWALIQAGIRPPGRDGAWGHDFVRSQFNGQLIHRRKRYPARLVDVLERARLLRNVADYGQERVKMVVANRVLTMTQTFVTAIRPGDDAT